MCGTCGCGQEDSIQIRKPGEGHTHQHTHDHNHDGHTHAHPHDHSHDHEHPHEHDHTHDSSEHAHHHHQHNHDHNHDHDHSHDRGHDHIHNKEVKLEIDILNKNNLLAERNRGFFEAKNIAAINLVSSPGSGKTSVLERTIQEFGATKKLYVVEGDQQTMNDANRIEAAGAPVVQVNTGNGCHLDAAMINAAIKKLEIKNGGLLIIENVGNLVCPAMFDLGESKRVVIISVTEGEDKPLKYPNMFQTADLCLINKIDLSPYVDFNIEKAKEYALRVNHHLEFIEVSAKTGDGFTEWMSWLEHQSK